MKELPPYRIMISPRRKRAAMRVSDEGILEFFAPPGMPEPEIQRLMTVNLRVIRKMYQEFASRSAPVRFAFTEGEKFPFAGKTLELKFSGRLAMICGNELLVPGGTPEEVRARIEKIYRAAAPEVLREKCLFYGGRRGLIPESVGVTAAVTRWGSCSSRKHISFCWKILLLPEELAGYIICHELAHLKELNHSKAFWALTEELCPGARLLRKKLRCISDPWPGTANNI